MRREPSGAPLASRRPYGRNTTNKDLGIYPSAQGIYPKKIPDAIVLETVVAQYLLIALYYHSVKKYT
jgi:hypothetical protein